MAARLSVVISQSSTRDSRAADIEERLLAELMMTAGLDTTLIGALEHVQPDSTDYLCLSGLTQSLAFASWLSIDEAREHWRRLELDGHIVELGAALPPSAGGRRVTFFSLQSPVEQIIEQVKQVLAGRSVQTFGLSMPGLGNQANGKKRSTTGVNGKVSKPASEKSEQGRAVPRATGPVALPLSPTKAADGSENISDEEWPELDRLVDDFDALDL